MLFYSMWLFLPIEFGNTSVAMLKGAALREQLQVLNVLMLLYWCFQSWETFPPFR